MLFHLLCELSHRVCYGSRGLLCWHSWGGLSGCSISWLLFGFLLPILSLLLLLLSFLGLLSISSRFLSLLLTLLLFLCPLLFFTLLLLPCCLFSQKTEAFLEAQLLP